MSRIARRLVFMVMVWATSFPCAALAEGRSFSRPDYENYFEPGRFASHSPFYASDGVLEIVSRRAEQLAGVHVLTQSIRTTDTSENYDTKSAYPYYKIMAENVERMAWDSRAKVYVFEYSPEEFDANASRVWESHDSRAEVSPGDRDGGLLHSFYREADRRAGFDPEVLQAEFRDSVVGVWTWSCAWIDNPDWDVACIASHLASEREETFFYRKLDLVG